MLSKLFITMNVNQLRIILLVIRSYRKFDRQMRCQIERVRIFIFI